MTGRSQRGPGGAGDDQLLPLILLLAVCGIGLLAWWPILAIAALRGIAVPANPAALALGLARHTVAWPGPLVLVLYICQLLAVSVGVVLVARTRRSRIKGSTRSDSALPHLARSGELIGLTPAQAAASAARLTPGTDPTDTDAHGVLLGRTVVGGLSLRMTWEDNLLVLAGPRVGKTTSLVIPPVVSHNGPVKTSSNRADVHDATRAVRERVGTVWLCDPQHLVNRTGHADSIDRASEANLAAEGPAFWWDPLEDVTSIALARELVQILIDCTVDRDARPDAYFHPTGRATLTSYVFAAALARASLLEVDAWLGDVNDTTPAVILDAAGYPAAARQIRSVLTKPDRQRDGVLGTAQSWLAIVTDPDYATWITPPPPGASVPRFDPEAFVRSTGDTLYLLSQHGPASASAITTALNAAVDRAGIAYARTQPSGRLPTPLLSVLDEAANTIRDSQLPEKFSHYGSRGMTTLVMLQSWSQGVDVWRERGMRALWSAANITCYLGGISETDFLKNVSDLLGERDDWYWTRSTSRAPRGNASTGRSQQVRRMPVLSVAELAALPRGRAVLLSSGNRPILIRPVPWMDGPHATAVEASLASWEPDHDRERRRAETTEVRTEIAGMNPDPDSFDPDRPTRHHTRSHRKEGRAA